MLRMALVSNAFFSGVSGGAIVILASWLTIQIPLPLERLWSVGVGLMLFSAYLIWVQKSEARQLKKTRIIIVGDWLWVASTSVAAVIFSGQITTVGWVLIVTVNIIVASLACLQFIGLKELLNSQASESNFSAEEKILNQT